ncbi:hypothetical protein [Corynebacterium terpenotabidum]|uniref:ABC transporter permease n=1 Tax=Corynebacterium terpenotabidum Y-11 TaxID=1200352 RepID=S4XFL3_9CORY|nr:hypothetical protein [Corynebacterium terpenotabidum]AGP31922.1 hypothetical protein A606_11415 [Corynebacterium terpenotabidum Y-11]
MRSLWYGIHAETVRLGGRRGPLVRASLPLGLLLPLLISLGVGFAAEQLHHSDGLIQVREVGTTNALFWVISLGITVHTVVAAYAQTTSTRGSVGELHRHLLPRTGPDLLARWAITGAAAALCCLVTVILVLTLLPVLFPGVYGQVDAWSPEGRRFLWAVPLYAVGACGIGIGVGALIRVPAAAVAVLTLWSLLIETALIYIPHGADLLGWMPFLNGQFATGQDIALTPSWGPDGALLYVFVVAGALLGTAQVISLKKHL